MGKNVDAAGAEAVIEQGRVSVVASGLACGTSGSRWNL